MLMIQWSKILQMDDYYVNVCEYISYWLSMSVVFSIKYILGLIIFVSGGIKELENSALKVLDVCILLYFEKIELYNSDQRVLLTTSQIWSGVLGFVGRLIILFAMACTYLISLIMRLFSWRFLLVISVSLRAVMTCIMFHFLEAAELKCLLKLVVMMLAIFCRWWGSRH